jgi:hypothetical protein
MISAPLMDMVETQNTFIDAAKAAGVRHVIKFRRFAPPRRWTRRRADTRDRAGSADHGGNG